MQIALAAAVALSFLCACSDAMRVPEGPPREDREPCQQHDPLRQPFFGDLHVHTAYSYDAYAFDVRGTPDQAYRFARGAPLSLGPLDAEGMGTRTVRLSRPLDFAAVTDHSEFLAEVDACTTPGAAGYESTTCETYRSNQSSGVTVLGTSLVSPSPTRRADLCGEDGGLCRDRLPDVWRSVVDAAEVAYDRSAACAFTSLIAYEYTGSLGASTQHRNVIFAGDRVPLPVSYYEQPTALGLWRALKRECIDAPGGGCDVIAIPHNTNESNGNAFRIEYPGASSIEEEREQAALRADLERLVEVYQHKGDSECRNGLSGIVGAPDEQCAFEKISRDGAADCGDGTGSGGAAGVGCISRLDYVRGILAAGLREGDRLGVNPYRLGLIASTDTHNATPGNVEERAFAGNHGSNDDSPEKRLDRGFLGLGGIEYGPGGLAGVWAEENTRGALFAALKRRETFGTSGPRIVVRMFGGADLPEALCDDPDLLRIGYERGVPMGGILAPGRAGAAPRFVVQALRDPGTPEAPGALLQRIQIVKGWVESGESHQRVFDAAGRANGADVDLATCEPRGPGAASLCAEWTDPAFDPAQAAFYYARVLENPTCRWSTWECLALPAADRPPACSDPEVPKTIQERAWTSPIWWDGARS
jgi:Protein of unknown function (DUF3604)